MVALLQFMLVACELGDQPAHQQGEGFHHQPVVDVTPGSRTLAGILVA